MPTSRITPGPDEATLIQSDATPEGPLCLHNEPTVLRVLNNGSKVYVCSRYPLHHCRTCCLADSVLAAQAAAEEGGGEEGATPSSPQQQQQGGGATALEHDVRVSPASKDPTQGSPSDVDATPSSQLLGSVLAPPDAPTKHGGHTTSVTSKAAPSTAVRSLGPIFAGFTAAAVRANQLGGRFVTMRPQAVAGSGMQGQLAESEPAATAPAEAASRKRPRQPEGGSATPAASGPASVGTASRGPEPPARVAMRLHQQFASAAGSLFGRTPSGKLPRQ